MKWSTGIITAPRQNSYYLDKTIYSLIKAGWSEPVIFAEPNSKIPTWYNGPVVNRRKQFGDWTNWATGLYELFLSEPESDYFFMLEDDAIFCRNCRIYLEYAMPLLGHFGSLSIYTPSRYYNKKRKRCFHNECQGKNTWSTVTIIMSHKSVLNFFADLDVQSHRFSDIFHIGKNYWSENASYGRGRKSIIDCVGNTVKDAVIGHWAEKYNLPMYYHSPALAEHIGNYSTLTDDLSTPENGRMSRDFVGEDADISSWIKQPIQIQRFKTLPLL